MKKMFLSGMVVMMALSFSSCKKDYTCTCTIGGIEIPTTIKDVKKSEAKDDCDEADAVAALAGGSCKLD